MILENLNGVSVKIGKDTTLENAVKQWRDNRNKLSGKLERKHKEWLKTPEGQDYLRGIKEKSKA